MKLPYEDVIRAQRTAFSFFVIAEYATDLEEILIRLKRPYKMSQMENSDYMRFEIGEMADN